MHFQLNKIFEDLLRDKFIVLSIKKLSKGSVIVHGTVSVVDDTKLSRVTELEKEFENSIRRRSFKMANYDIDPDTIQLRNEDDLKHENTDFNEFSSRNSVELEDHSLQSGRDDFEKTNNLPKTDAASSQAGFPGYAIGIIIGLKRMRNSGSEYIQNGSRQTTFPKPTQAYSGPSAYEMSGSAAGAGTPGNGAQVNAYLNHGYQRDRQNGQNRHLYVAIKLKKLRLMHVNYFKLNSATRYSRPCATVGYPVQSACRYSRPDGTVGHPVYNARHQNCYNPASKV
uniref:SEA domain-containing protein n=1 Tax=Romanomermis culicivorax TaxID=13658 RepID=A0A915KPG1_ROMCU